MSNLVHYIFITKRRIPLIEPELESRLWPFMGGIARKNHMQAMAIGGTKDHIHMLVSLPATISVAKGIQLIKGGSSKWVHDEFPGNARFEWQDGYGAFSVSASQIKAVINYIDRQKEHHRRNTFEEEFIQFLDECGVQYDRRYVFR